MKANETVIKGIMETLEQKITEKQKHTCLKKRIIKVKAKQKRL